MKELNLDVSFFMYIYYNYLHMVTLVVVMEYYVSCGIRKANK